MRKTTKGVLVALFALAMQTASAQAEIVCRQTEQVGCIELDILNYKWEHNNSRLSGLDRPHANVGERVERVTSVGPRLYRAWKDGQVRSAERNTYFVYVWNPALSTPTAHMSVYRMDTPQSRVTRHEVREIFPSRVPVLDPEFDLGRPSRVFEVTAVGGVVAFQVPWSMIGDGTYILICSSSDGGVYPDRRNGKTEGHWLTPEYLGHSRNRGLEYLVIPFLK